MKTDRASLSIVTINYNNPVGLRRTAESLAAARQAGLKFEWIVVDGGSTTGDLALLSEFTVLADARVTSERDRGIYDAMNKGWRTATGDYVQFLNSGDFLLLDGYAPFFNAALQHPTVDVHYAFVRLYAPDMTPGLTHGPDTSRLNKTTIAHMSALTHRRVFERLSGFDEQYRIAADRDFFIRAYKAGFTFEQQDHVVAGFPQDGASTNHRKTRLEDLSISRKHGYLGTLRYGFKKLQTKLKHS